ncbi:hypothetical protein M9H77_01324 [Catharanthus roseus]|uniref:Uncharacterized protein n=1 Tax=Catharanthus roseus TaxID=4058 RepID=A0ACC0C5G6_CATRO|nr:hypothetical protein M9H77_01324 [Catharanthus roseus]
MQSICTQLTKIVKAQLLEVSFGLKPGLGLENTSLSQIHGTQQFPWVWNINPRDPTAGTDQISGKLSSFSGSDTIVVPYLLLQPSYFTIIDPKRMKTNKNSKPKSITKCLLHEIFFLHRLLLRLEHSEQRRKLNNENCNEKVSEKGKKNKSRETYLPPRRPIQGRVLSAWSTSSGDRVAVSRNKVPMSGIRQQQ